MSAPSTAAARLHVICSTCCLAGLLPAPAEPSDKSRLATSVYVLAADVAANAVVLPTAFAWYLWALQLESTVC